MTEPPTLSSAIGIEAVEVIPAGANVTVRVTGRWRRRRPEWRGPAILVVEALGARHRFPAMPEPPSVIGALPGTWRISFTVAAELAAHLGGSAWLQFGSVVAPLSIAVGSSAAPAPERLLPEPTTIPERQLRAADVAAESARRRVREVQAVADELADRIARLEAELSEAGRSSDALRDELRRTRGQVYAAHQRVHAEAARRGELDAALNDQRDAAAVARGQARRLEDRGRELARERDRLRRDADEAQHAADAAGSALARMEAGLLARAPVESRRELGQAVIPGEFKLARQVDSRVRQATARAPGLGVPTAPAWQAPKLAAETRMLEARHDRVGADVAAGSRVAETQRRLREAEVRRAETEAGLAETRSRLVDTEARLAETEARLGDTERRLSSATKLLAEQRVRSEQAYQAVGRFRRELVELRLASAPKPPAPVAPASAAPGEASRPVEIDRLSDALSRLRATTPRPEGPDDEADSQPSPPAAAQTEATGGWASTLRFWLGRLLRKLARRR